MIKFLSASILTLLLSLALCVYLPWWSISIASFITALAIHQPAIRAFLSGFLALFLLWGILALLVSINNDHLLAHKISLLILKTDSPFLLILVTALIGALVAGLSALTGSFLRATR